jgi:hypothetical protein
LTFCFTYSLSFLLFFRNFLAGAAFLKQFGRILPPAAAEPHR